MFGVLRLLPVGDRDRDAEILALRHQLGVLQRQLGDHRIRFTHADRALLAALLQPMLRWESTLDQAGDEDVQGARPATPRDSRHHQRAKPARVPRLRWDGANLGADGSCAPTLPQIYEHTRTARYQDLWWRAVFLRI